MKKALIIVLSVFVVVAVAVGILLFNLEKVVNNKKEYFLARAEKQIGRSITIEDIGVGVWPSIGVRLRGVVVADDPAFAAEPFLICDNAAVNVKVLPLIRKQVQMSRLVLERPRIAIIKNAEGVFNFNSMIASPGDSAVVEPAHAAAAVPLVLAVADIKDGELHFVDQSLGIDATVTRINAGASDVALDREVRISLSAAMFGEETDVEMSGAIGPVGESTAPADLARAPVRVDVTMRPTSAAAILARIPHQEKLYRADVLRLGDVSFHSVVQGTAGALSVKTTAALSILGAEQANVALTADVGPLDAVSFADAVDPVVPVSGEIKLGPINMAVVREIAGVAGVARPDLVMAGNAQGSCEFEGDNRNLTLALNINCDGASVTFGEKFNKAPGVPMNAKAAVVVGDKGAIAITSSELVFSGARVQMTGAVDASQPGQRDLDLKVVGKVEDVSSLVGLTSELAVDSPRGQVDVAMRVRGVASQSHKPDVSGTLVLKSGGGKLAQVPGRIANLSATMDFTTNTAKLRDASLDVGSSHVETGATASSLRPLQATFEVTSLLIHREDFNVAPKPSPRPEVLNDVVFTGEVKQAGPTDVVLDGVIRSPRGSISNIDYTELNATVKATKENTVIDKFSARALDGVVSGSGTFEVKATPPRFDLVMDVKKVNLAQYFAHKFSALPKFIEGNIDLKLDVGGSGKTWEEVQPTLKGSGVAVVVQGALLNMNVAQEFVNGIQSMPLVPQSFGQRMQTRYPNMFKENRTVFKDLSGSLKIENGRVLTSGLLLQSNEFDIAGDGWFSLTSELLMNTVVTLSAKLTSDVIAEIPAARFLAGPDGRIAIPLNFSGNATRPRIVLDSDALMQKLQTGAVDESVGNIKDKLKGILNKKKN